MPFGKEHVERHILDCIIEITHKPLKEKGEDAFAYSFEKDTAHSQAVFDGCGGSGSWQYSEFRNATGAFIAAHSMCKSYLEWFNATSVATLTDVQKAEESFHSMATRTLKELKNRCAPMKVSGSMVKSFPCTASIAITIPKDDYLSVTTLNVGDSRVYFLAPNTGLVQLTVDDSEEDPLESLRSNAPMTDMLNADNPFQIEHRQLYLTYPCAIITATDGVFGYVRSPMDFEYMVLNSIMHSESFNQFENTFKDEIIKVTGDDSTCIISFYGWGSFEAVKRKLSKRYSYVRSIIDSLDTAMEAGTLDAALETVWREYRKQTVYDEMRG